MVGGGSRKGGGSKAVAWVVGVGSSTGDAGWWQLAVAWVAAVAAPTWTSTVPGGGSSKCALTGKGAGTEVRGGPNGGGGVVLDASRRAGLTVP